MPASAGLAQADFVFLSNRGSRIFEQALVPLGGRPYRSGDKHVDLLYFDRYGGKTPPTEPTVGFTLIDRQLTIPLDNKAKMARALIANGSDNPRVYFEAGQVPDRPGSLWYLKDPLATAGRGIQVLPREQLEANFRPGWIIQEAVEDLSLVLGRKFTLRLYLLVNQGRLFLFPDGFMVVHGVEYRQGSTDPRAQFDHDGYMDRHGAVRLRPFAEFEAHGKVMERLKPELLTIFSVFGGLWRREKAHSYCVFGVDLLVKDDLSSVLIEINDRPNFVHTNAINEAINIPMVQAMCCVLSPVKLQRLSSGASCFEQLGVL